MNENVVLLDDHRELSEIIRRRFPEITTLVFCAEIDNGQMVFQIPPELTDIKLVYMIQTLQDLRNARL